MRGSGHSAQEDGGKATPQEQNVASRRTTRQWPILVATVVCAATAGFLAALPFWRREKAQPSVPQRGDRATTVVQEEWADEPAFSPDATADELKQEAIRTTDQLLEAFPDSTDSLGVAARLQLSIGHSDVAVGMWRRCAEIDPRFADAYFGMGLAAKAAGDSQEAAKLFQKVISLAPSEPRAPSLLADALMKLGKAEEAVRVLEGHVRAQEPLPDAAVSLGQAYLQLGEYEKARQTLEALLEKDPNQARAYYGLAKAYARLGQKEKSNQCLEKFKSYDSVAPEEDVRYTRGVSDLATLRGLLVQTLIESGEAYRRRSTPATAEQMWRKAAVLDAKNTQCRRELLSLYEEQDRDHDALAVCEELCKIEPQNADHWLNVGLLNGRLQRFDAAVAAIERAIRLDPDNPKYRQAHKLVKERE